MPSERAKRLARMERRQLKLLLEERTKVVSTFADEFLAMTEDQQAEWVKGYEKFLAERELEGDEPGST